MRLRIKDKHTGSEQVFSITSNEDFTPIIMTYPDVREVVFYQYEQRGYGDYYKHFRGLVDAVAEHLNKIHGVEATVEADNIFEYKNPQDPFEKAELEKGQNGDWEKEGYTIHISDKNAWGKKIPEPSVYAFKDGQQVGFAHSIVKDGKLKVSSVMVDKPHRRKGIASAMYQALENHKGQKLEPNEQQFDDGKALWADPNRKFGKNEKAKLALIAASLAFTPINLQPATLTKAISPDVFKYRPYGHKPEDRFLQAIMQLESTGGKNLNHPEKNCIGRWGLMLNTIKDMVKIFDHKNADTQLILSMNGDELKKLFKKRPELELHIARIMARFVLAKFNGDLDRSAYAWKYGQNSQPTKDDLENSDYVRKFRFFTGNISKSEPEKFEDKFKKWVLKREQDKQDNELAIPSIAYASTDKQKLPKLTTSYDRLINNIEQSN